MQSALRQPETNLPLPEEMFSPALPVSIKAVGSYEQVRQSFRRQADQFMDETIVGRVDAALAEYRAQNPGANEFYLSVNSREFADEEIAYLDEDAQANPAPLRAEAGLVDFIIAKLLRLKIVDQYATLFWRIA